MPVILDKLELLRRLDEIRYEKEEEKEKTQFEHINLADSLLALAEINHEREYLICKEIAEHFLGYVPQPDDAGITDIDDELSTDITFDISTPESKIKEPQKKAKNDQKDNKNTKDKKPDKR